MRKFAAFATFLRSMTAESLLLSLSTVDAAFTIFDSLAMLPAKSKCCWLSVMNLQLVYIIISKKKNSW